MAIEKLHIRNLSAFNDVKFEFSPGVNVLLGANSTGKTHVLKWLYATLKIFGSAPREGETEKDRLRASLGNVFVPDRRYSGGLVRRGGAAPGGRIEVCSAGEVLAYSLHSSRNQIDLGKKNNWKQTLPVMYVPSREMLAHYEGFVAAYIKRESAFDETFFDLCVALGESPLRAEPGAFAFDVSAQIERVIGGAVELDGGRFYVNFKSSGGPRLEAHLVAEGLRKLASIARLVRTGGIAKGSLLLWDEPESGMNPRLVAAVARILGVLVRAGVQVVLATHDFLLAQRISLLAEAKDPIPARFFLLSREGEGSPVHVVSGATYTDIPRTPSEEEYLRLQDDHRALFMEG